MPREYTRVPVSERFWQRVDVRGPDDCWPWLGATSDGYGRIGNEDGTTLAHRVAYELTYGPLPDDVLVRHFICSNPPCCNPGHLRPGDKVENALDALRDGAIPTGDRHYSRQYPEKVRRGSQLYQARLTESAVLDIRDRAASGVEAKKMAAEYGVSRRTIADAVNRITWKHV